jgi:hypothetical protein
VLQQSLKKNLPQLSLILLTGVGLLLFIFDKAYNLSFTHDESYSYLHYVHQGFMDIISYKTPYTNNHILNTVFMKYCEVFFGNSEIALRLPNIVAFIIYSAFATLLLNRHCPKLVLPGYLLLVLNPYLLDFFALARGYGLSIGFLLMSIYYLSIYFSTKQNKHLILFNVGAFLAVMSNFSLLNYYVAALIVYNVIVYIDSKLNALNEKKVYHFYTFNKINLISVLLSGMVLYEPLRRISKKSMLDFGGKKGFLEDTVASSIDDLFFEAHVTEFYVIVLKTIVLFVTFYSFALIIIKFIKKENDFFAKNIILVFINLTLLTIVLITLIQHVVLGNDFYVHRFALFFYPLFILNLTFLISYFYEKEFKWTSISFSYLFMILLSVNLFKNHSLTYFKDWKYDQNTKLVMQQLKKEHDKLPNKQMRLGVNWLFEPGTNFYRYTWNLNWMNPTHRRGISKHDDYFYLFNIDKEAPLLSDKTVLFSDEKTGCLLIKN